MAKTYRPRTDGLVSAVEVVQDNIEEIKAFCGGIVVKMIHPMDATQYSIGVNVPTLDGVVRAQEGDFIVKSREGHVSVMPAHDFNQKFERVGTR